MLSVGDLTREELSRLYLDAGLTEGEIARRYVTYQVKVGRLRRSWGIPTVGKTGRITMSLPPLTDVQREVLTGSLHEDAGTGRVALAHEHFFASDAGDHLDHFHQGLHKTVLGARWGPSSPG